ncbi:MAG: hypothetical protein HW415_1487 [Deltaproteobacteria bacterium]|nr:hypothetical protein [Deltaproteobacteria bacterium]
MADRRIEFSLSNLETILLLCSGLIVLIVAFVLGVMVGKSDIKGLPGFEKEVKSEVVKMRIESPPLEQPADQVTAQNNKTASMNNTSSKPVMTFYDTLAKPGNNKKESLPSDYKNASRKVYAVQAGAMRDKSLADAMVLKLKKNGYSAYIVSSESSGKGIWHKVRLGAFSNKEDAHKEAARIEKNEGMSATVVEK